MGVHGGIELTPLQVAKICYNNGLDPDDGKGLYIVNAIAICYGESSFFTGAWNFNDTSGDKSYGLWQINMIEPIGAERRIKFNLADNEDLFDPNINCRVMLKMSNLGSNFKPWGAYTNGSYRYALGVAVAVRAALLKSLGRSVSAVLVPDPLPALPVLQRPWVSFRQIKAAAVSASGVHNLASGDTSKDDVIRYQRALWKLQPNLLYMYRRGYYDEKTKKATTAFQKAQGWSGSDADGIVGPETIKRVAAKSQLFRVRDW